MKRFKMKSDKINKSEKENLMEYKVKLDDEIKTQEKRAESFSKQIIWDKLINDENLEADDLRELLQMGNKLKISQDKTVEKSCVRSLKEMKTLTNTAVDQVKSKMRKVSEGGDSVNEWSVIMYPDKTNYPEVMMNMKFVTWDKLISESEMPTIRHFSATLTPLQVDAELEAAVDHCKRNIEPQLLTQLIKQYLPLHAARQEIFSQVDTNHCRVRSEKILEFFNSEGNILGHLYLIIKFKKRFGFGWESTWRTKLTDEGKEACKNLHIDQDIINKGFIESWNWSKVVETLSKVAMFDVIDSPSKANESVDVSNIDTSTPVSHLRKITKRKL